MNLTSKLLAINFLSINCDTEDLLGTSLGNCEVTRQERCGT